MQKRKKILSYPVHQNNILTLKYEVKWKHVRNIEIKEKKREHYLINIFTRKRNSGNDDERLSKKEI